MHLDDCCVHLWADLLPGIAGSEGAAHPAAHGAWTGQRTLLPLHGDAAPFCCLTTHATLLQVTHPSNSCLCWGPVEPPNGCSEGWGQLWVSEAASTCPTHRDQPNGVLVVLWGRKVVRVAPPEAAQGVVLKGASQMRFADEADGPLGERCHNRQLWQEFTLGPGQFVIIPAGHWHSIASAPGTVAFSWSAKIGHVSQRPGPSHRY